MAKPEWGIKRMCPSCGARFYDLDRKPVVCPGCQSSFQPDAFLRARRNREPSPETAAEPVVTKNAVQPGNETVGTEADGEGKGGDAVAAAAAQPLGDDEAKASEGEKTEEDLIEDASELGEDEDDVAEVMENVKDKSGEP